jgi:hypothetical protein
MTETLWLRVRPEISLGHLRLMKEMGLKGLDVSPYIVPRMYYSKPLMCGVIEVTTPQSARLFRKDVFTRLRLTTRLRALLSDEPRLPALSMLILDESYLEYQPDDVVEVYMDIWSTSSHVWLPHFSDLDAAFD